MAAGEAYGFVQGSMFKVYSSPDPESQFVGEFIARSVTNFAADLEPVDSSTDIGDLPVTAYALLTRAGPGQEFKVYIPQGLSYIAQAIKDQPLGKARDIPIRICSSHQDHPFLSLIRSNQQYVSFEIHEEICEKNGLTRLYREIRSEDGNPPTGIDRLQSILSGAADFCAHLHRSPGTSQLCTPERVSLRCFELEETIVEGAWMMTKKDPGTNLIKENILELRGRGHNIPYGFQVVNKTKMPLYAALFYFDFGDLSISKLLVDHLDFIINLTIYVPLTYCVRAESYYEPGIARDNHVDFCLPEKGSLAIGYGSSGAKARTYRVRNGYDLDIGILKLFVSTQWVDWSNIKQKTPFGGVAREDNGPFIPKGSPWDVVCVPIVQRLH